MEKRNVPKLRFKDQNGYYYNNWSEIRLGDVIVEYNKVTTCNNQYEALTSSRRGLFLQKDYFNKQIASEDNTGYTIVPRGYFTYRHMSDDSIFYFNINNLLDYGIVSTLYPVFTTTKDMNSNFLQYYLNESSYFRRYCLLQKQGGSRTYMYLNKLKDFKGLFPCLEEQTKIANFLSKVDKIIEEEDLKVKDLELYKKGMMQKIFKQEIRFKDDNGENYPKWEEKKLDKVLKSRVEKQVPSIDVPLMAFTATGGIEHKGERYDRSFLVKDDKKLYKRTELNDFIYSSNNLDVGSIGLNKYGSAVISDVYEIFKINKSNSPIFISELLKTPRLLYKIIRYRQGVMYGQYRIHVNDFLNINEFIPCLEEQTKIANFLSNIDKIIEEENKNLEDLRLWKHGLLQQMFV